MADIVLSGKGYENKFIESKDLKKMYLELFDGLSGTVAVEPFPDDATRTTLGAPVSYDYGVDHLKALLAAIKESTAAAKDRGAQLRFVVASADPKVVDLLQELDAGSLKKTTGGRFAT